MRRTSLRHGVFVLTLAGVLLMGTGPARPAVVAFDNLADGFNTGAYSQLIDFFEYMEAGSSFTTPVLGYLSAVELPMTNSGFGGHARLAVHQDSGGSIGSLVEAADIVPATGAPAVYHVPFSVSHLLQPGSTYWLVVSPVGYPSSFNWYLPNTFSDQSSRLTRRSPEGTWAGPYDEENGFRILLEPADGGGGGGGGPNPGDSQSNPLLPDSYENGIFTFTQAPSGRWFDPPLAGGFLYTMDSPDALFTAITGLPVLESDADGLFTVAAEGQSLGQFGPDDTVDFVALLGHGVTAFSVTGIDPLVDAAQPDCFPLAITFSTPTADFSMQAIPEPASLSLLLAAGLVIRPRRPHRRLITRH